MVRLFFVLLLSFCAIAGNCQQYSVAVGVYGGITIPYTLDDGIDNDPRYSSSYTVKGLPIGLSFAVDHEDVGFQISPGMFTLGQNYNIVNVSGGHDGERKIDMKYFILPFAFKYHIIDLSFFRVSALASASAAFLYDASDHLSHGYTNLKFPPQTYPIIEQLPGYSIEYNGVISPETSLYVSEKADYQTVQFFAGLGLCSDWDLSTHWRVSFDFRVNYGILEPRSDDYMTKIAKYESIYDVPGRRREMFGQLSIGISRYLNVDKGDRDRQKNLKGKKKFEPKSQYKIRKRGKPK